jgi:hypothetical protein
MTLASRILGGEVSKVEHHPTGVIDVVGTAMKENS